ncbi:hypothetical protein M3I54_02515 [Paraburkholderia sp. CNPSo 3274]|uniref:hypothetical protein n=1 Tax=Paraburkholderia sp. CNPSo 3274 TaxID=2940932 RepID=UPI0020B74FA7|nr:hypothetical protein [Paraburkholderia sp. CNPSo 3274]MCP3705871.1 hypothetical protein [Paraburkholderia sp. CNPSo 3274]
MKKNRKKLKIIRKERTLRKAARRARNGGHPHKVPMFDLMNRKENPGGKIIGNSSRMD